MTIYDFPSGIRIKNSQFKLESNVQTFTSPLSNSTQRIILPGKRWVATYELTSHTRAEFAVMKAFLIQQEGGLHTFYGFDADARQPLGVATGTPLIKGAGQTGLSILTDGWTPNTTGILKQADYIQVGNEMKMVMANVNSDGSGNATILISHAFRSSPADNAPIITNNPCCVMRLIDNQQDMWDSDANKNCTITFRAVETFV